MPHPFILRQALSASLANALINGLRTWFAVRDRASLFLSMDSISAGSSTVLGKAVAGAFALGLACTAVSYLTFRSAARKKGVGLVDNLSFWPKYVLLMVKNAVFVFGALVSVAILFQRAFGSIEVNGLAASLISGGIAFAVTFYTALATMQAMVKQSK